MLIPVSQTGEMLTDVSSNWSPVLNNDAIYW